MLIFINRLELVQILGIVFLLLVRHRSYDCRKLGRKSYRQLTKRRKI